MMKISIPNDKPPLLWLKNKTKKQETKKKYPKREGDLAECNCTCKYLHSHASAD